MVVYGRSRYVSALSCSSSCSIIGGNVALSCVPLALLSRELLPFVGTVAVSSASKEFCTKSMRTYDRVRCHVIIDSRPGFCTNCLFFELEKLITAVLVLFSQKLIAANLELAAFVCTASIDGLSKLFSHLFKTTFRRLASRRLATI